MMAAVPHAGTMTENLAAPHRDGLPGSILAPTKRRGVPAWVLVVSVLAAFALGWAGASYASPSGRAPAVTPIETESATPEPVVDDQDDSGFVRVASRDLDDFSDDLDDLDTTLDENGFWRLLSNAVELNFNVSQLLQHEAPASVEEDWAAEMEQVQDDVDAIEAGIAASSDAKVRAAVADARDTLQRLRGVVARVD